MKNIEMAFWCDGKSVRLLKTCDLGLAFKWVLVEKDRVLILLVMPKLEGLDFHKELRDRVCLLKDWSVNELKMLGGGVNFDGEILHRSTYFGEIPYEFRKKTLTLLGLN